MQSRNSIAYEVSKDKNKCIITEEIINFLASNYGSATHARCFVLVRQRQLSGGGIYSEDALSKLSHTANVCVAGFLIDPNLNRFVRPNFFIACCLVRFAAFLF